MNKQLYYKQFSYIDSLNTTEIEHLEDTEEEAKDPVEETQGSTVEATDEVTEEAAIEEDAAFLQNIETTLSKIRSHRSSTKIVCV